MSITDLAVVRALTGMTVVVASDHVQLRQALPQIADCCGETGPYEQLLDKYGMGVEDIVRSAHRALALKEKRRTV